jgi:hypothetical protein
MWSSESSKPFPILTPLLNIALQRGPNTFPGPSTAHLQLQQLSHPKVIPIPRGSTVPRPSNTTIQGISIAPLSHPYTHRPILKPNIAKSTTNTTTVPHSSARQM